MNTTKTELVTDYKPQERPSTAPQTQTTQTETSHNNDSPHNPQQLISQGISFFSGLAETLKSPEATKQLIDNIVDVNAETGETSIKIPVADKESVVKMFSLFGKLLQR